MRILLMIVILLTGIFLPATLTADVPKANLAGVLVPQGMLVKIRLDPSLGDKINPTGARVPFTVVEPVFFGGIEIIREGALAMGRIENAGSSGLSGRDGRLIVKDLAVEAANGERIPLVLGPRSIMTNDLNRESTAFAGALATAGSAEAGSDEAIAGRPAGSRAQVEGKALETPLATELVVEVPHDILL